MDFIGEIVEHESEAPVAPNPVAMTGFPDLNKIKNKRMSRWRSSRKPDDTESSRPIPVKKEPVLSESEKIHRENLDKLSKMTDEELSEERQELLSSLNPKLVQSLLNRTEKRLQTENTEQTHGDHTHGDLCDHGHAHAEGYNGWIGGIKTAKGLSDLSQLDKEDVERALGNISLDDDLERTNKLKKSVKFDDVTTIKYEDLDEDVPLDPNGWEDVDDINDLIPNIDPEDEIAHDDYQLVNDDEDDERIGVHFPKPKASEELLDLNDPEFYEKLHEKYYPDLPKETKKLSWMTEPVPKQISTTYESISDMRFDFQGDLLELNDERKESTKEIPTYMGLHHHSNNPHQAGYTLNELVHLSRSVVPGQRCLSIQMLGRILHKLGLHKYSILPIDDTNTEDAYFNENLKELVTNFEILMWNLIEQLRIIESITEAADETKTRNMSVRNYAIEALWLWKQGGGKPETQTEEDIITKAVQQN